MPRFVLLTHDHPVWHWDFMLESSGQLRTWRLDADPTAGERVNATPLPDHRLDYLDYEGPVSQNRGTVQRIDRGEYELIAETAESLEIALRGDKLQGGAKLQIELGGTVSFQYFAGPRPVASTS